MIPEQQAAYVFAQSVSALIEALGMLSANMARIMPHELRSVPCSGGLPIPYFRPEKFSELIDKYGIGHNDVLGFYQQ